MNHKTGCLCSECRDKALKFTYGNYCPKCGYIRIKRDVCRCGRKHEGEVIETLETKLGKAEKTIEMLRGMVNEGEEDTVIEYLAGRDDLEAAVNAQIAADIERQER